jgi:hypothetical protein
MNHRTLLDWWQPAFYFKSMPWPRVFGHSGRAVDKRRSRVKVARKNPFIARLTRAYLNFELKDHDRRRRRAFGASLTSKFRYARVSRAMNGKV